MALHAQGQGLQAAHGQKAVEGTGDRADSVLQEPDAFAQIRVLAHHQHAADDVGMPVQIFGRRMHDDIEAMLQRPLHPGAGEGVVADGDDSALARDGRNGGQIDQLQQGIGGRLYPNHFRLGLEGGFQRAQVGQIGEGEAVAGGALANAGEQAPAAAVEILHGHDMRAAVEQFERGG